MNILITGGAGFIGSHLADALSNLGHEVTLLDLPGKFSTSQVSNFATIQKDITDASCFYDMPKFDVVYHLAAQVGTAGSLQDVHKDLKYNAYGTLNVVEYALRANVKKLIFSSSMAVYGEVIDANEDTSLKPISPYGISKSCAEEYVRFCERKSKEMQCVIFRIFNCYGPGQSTKNLTQGLASIFLEQVRDQTTIKVTGPLERKRDLIYIDDVIRALLLPLKKPEMSGSYNLCSGDFVEIGQLIKKIITISKKDERLYSVKNIGGLIEDPISATGKSDKLKLMNWKPLVSLDDGLRICWDLMNE